MNKWKVTKSVFDTFMSLMSIQVPWARGSGTTRKPPGGRGSASSQPLHAPASCSKPLEGLLCGIHVLTKENGRGSCITGPRPEHRARCRVLLWPSGWTPGQAPRGTSQSSALGRVSAFLTVHTWVWDLCPGPSQAKICEPS